MSTPQPRLAAEVHAYAAGSEIPAAPVDLLARARRADAVQHRRTRPAWQPALVAVASVVAILALVVGGLGALLGDAPDSSGVAGRVDGSAAVAAIPDRLERPSAWLTVDETPGRAAVVMPGERKSLLGSTRSGVVVVSATTGAYTWLPLDLGDRSSLSFPVDRGRFSLSPTGELIAYWVVEDNPDGFFLTDLRILDLSTGRERRVPMKRATSTPGSMSWQDATTLVYSTVEWTAPRSSDGGGQERRTTGAPVRAVRWPMMQRFGPSSYGQDPPGNELLVTPAGTAVLTDRGRFRLVDLRTGGGVVSDAGPPGFVQMPRGVAYDSLAVLGEPTEGWTVGIDFPRGELRATPWRGPVDAGAASRPGETRALLGASAAPPLVPADIVGHVGGDEVAVLARSGRVADSFSADDFSIVAVDLGDGRTRPLIEGGGLWDMKVPGSMALSYASDLWAVPTVTRPEPEDPVSPRLLAGAGAAGLGIAVVFGVRVMRRRQRV